MERPFAAEPRASPSPGTFPSVMKPVQLIRVGIVASVLFALAAAPATAACGGVQRAVPHPRRHWYMPPLAIGDSVLLGAIPQVVHAGFQVDTRGCRAWDEGDRVLWRHRHTHSLPHLVVMFLAPTGRYRCGRSDTRCTSSGTSACSCL